jgi:integrase
LPGRGHRLRPCTSYQEAERLLDAALVEIHDGRATDPGGDTLRCWGEAWLDRRELDGYGGIIMDRSRWVTHIATAHFIDWPLDAITPADIYQWIDNLKARKASKGKGHKKLRKRLLARTTMQNTLNLLRCCMGDARDRGKLKANPCDGVRLGKRREAATHDPWTYLRPDEQDKLLHCEDIADEDRRLLAFAMGSGLRESEQWNLHLADVHDAGRKIIVRYGSKHTERRVRAQAVPAKGGPTKGGKPRVVHLFGIAREALAQQLEALRGRKNPLGLVWPSPRGCRRQPKAPRHWATWLAAADIQPERREDGMPVRWHNLRHTCAASLVSGWWGRRWRLEEIKELLGHEDISTTERYAHLHEQALKAAAEDADRKRARALGRGKKTNGTSVLVVPR